MSGPAHGTAPRPPSPPPDVFVLLSRCELAYSSTVVDSYAAMLTDVMHTIPPQLLGSLLHEELAAQRDRALACEGATGGALAFVPFSQSGGGGGSQRGCLLYPRRALDLLNILKNLLVPAGLFRLFQHEKVPVHFLMRRFRLPHGGAAAPARRPLARGRQEPPSLRFPAERPSETDQRRLPVQSL